MIVVFREAARRIKTNAKNAVTRENAGKVYRGAKSAVSSVGHAAGQAADTGARYGARVHRNTQTSPLLNGQRTIQTRTGSWTVDDRQQPRHRSRDSTGRSRGEHVSYGDPHGRREHVSFAGDSRRGDSHISFAGNNRQGGYISFAGSNTEPKRGGKPRRRRRR